MLVRVPPAAGRELIISPAWSQSLSLPLRHTPRRSSRRATAAQLRVVDPRYYRGAATVAEARGQGERIHASVAFGHRCFWPGSPVPTTAGASTAAAKGLLFEQGWTDTPLEAFNAGPSQAGSLEVSVRSLAGAYGGTLPNGHVSIGKLKPGQLPLSGRAMDLVARTWTESAGLEHGGMLAARPQRIRVS